MEGSLFIARQYLLGRVNPPTGWKRTTRTTLLMQWITRCCDCVDVNLRELERELDEEELDNHKEGTDYGNINA